MLGMQSLISFDLPRPCRNYCRGAESCTRWQCERKRLYCVPNKVFSCDIRCKYEPQKVIGVSRHGRATPSPFSSF